ncbi:tetratricopeptide repeat protein [Permianibacter sp. IMCC34836]|uniref:tetratricopeptide repeat protein n=1 Tax=Permianibacter fluminis TaxID=2738515 RepID=UPI0015523D42|nr:tetratricopeptide repeat protein [Permianibacter fluminis]NQD38053.1 tetratricopeptide repeat protein [Permianibacter fluminis]
MQLPAISYDDALLRAQQLLLSAQHQGAIQLSSHLLQMQPHDPTPFYILAVALSQLRQYDRAREALHHALKLAPERSELWLALGKTHDSEQQFAAATPCYETAVACAPSNLIARYALARNLEAQKLTDAALAQYQALTQSAPADTDAREGLWRCLRNLQRREELCHPDKLAEAVTPILRIIRAKTLIELGTDSHLTEAESLLQQTLTEQPQRPDALAALSLLYRVRGDFDHCLPIAQQLMAAEPDRTEGYLGCIESLIAMDRDREAWAIGQQAAARSGSQAMLMHAAAYIANIPLSNAHIEHQRQRVQDGIKKILASGARANNPLREAPLTYFYFAYHGCNNKALLSYIADSLRKLAPSLTHVAEHCRKPRRSGPLRIAFVSTFMRDHPVGRCYQPLLQAMAAKGQVTIQVYTKLKEADPLQQQLREHAIPVVPLPLELVSARAAIESFAPDVMLYGDIGMDNFTYYLAFSRLATVQCLLPGHPETSGIDTLDFFLSQQALEGPQPASRYREQPILLNHFAMAYPAANPVHDARDRSALALPTERFYLVPAKLQKIHPDFDTLVAEILRRDRDAVVLYFEDQIATGWGKTLRARLAAQMPELMPRIRFRRWAEKADFQAILSHADAILDPIHFGLGTTAIYALAQGQPIVTLPLDNMASHPTTAMLQQIGVTDSIASSRESYVDIAYELANDSAHRTAIGKRIAAGFPRLFDAGNAATELLQFLHKKTRIPRQHDQH